MCNNNETFQVTETNSSPVSPPPFMVGMVEIELDKETGHIEILDYVAVVDCGTPVNPKSCKSSGRRRARPGNRNGIV